MEWNGMEWNRMECNGMEWNGMESNKNTYYLYWIYYHSIPARESFPQQHCKCLV